MNVNARLHAGWRENNEKVLHQRILPRATNNQVTATDDLPLPALSDLLFEMIGNDNPANQGIHQP